MAVKMQREGETDRETETERYNYTGNWERDCG